MPLTFWAFYALVQLVPRQWTYSKSEIRLCVYFMAVQCSHKFNFGEFKEVRNFHSQPFWVPIFCEIWFFKDAYLNIYIFKDTRVTKIDFTKDFEWLKNYLMNSQNVNVSWQHWRTEDLHRAYLIESQCDYYTVLGFNGH